MCISCFSSTLHLSFSLLFSFTSSSFPLSKCCLSSTLAFVPPQIPPSFSPSCLVGVFGCERLSLKRRPPLLLGVIIYKRGHINVSTANTVGCVSVCVCVSLSGPWCQHGPLCFSQHSLPPIHSPNPPSRSQSPGPDSHSSCLCASVCLSLLLIPWLLLSCTFMNRAHSLLNHRHIFQIPFLKLPHNPQTNFTGIDAELK